MSRSNEVILKSKGWSCRTIEPHPESALYMIFNKNDRSQFFFQRGKKCWTINQARNPKTSGASTDWDACFEFMRTKFGVTA